MSRADDIKRGVRVSEKRATKRPGDVDWREGYEPRHGDVLRCHVRGDEYQQSYVAVYRDYVGDGVGASWACDGTEIHEETPLILFEAVEILYRRPAMNRAVTAPMTPERLAEIRGLQVD